MLRSLLTLALCMALFPALAHLDEEPTGDISMEWLAARSLHIRPAASGLEYLAINHRQDLISKINAKGLTVSGPARSPVWETSILVDGIRRGCGPVEPWTPIGPCSREQELDWQGKNLTVQYQHSDAGMRQNFIVERAPTGTGDLQVLLSTSGDLRVQALDQRSVHFVDEWGIERFRYEDLYVWDACGTVLDAYMSVDAEHGSLVLHVDDRDAMYPVTVDPVTTSTVLVLTSSDAEFGWSVHSAGDLNGDGYSDVVVGAPKYSSGEFEEGGAFVYYGGPNGIGTVPDVILESNQDSAYFGHSAAHAGDVNGDGFSDLIVGAIYWESDPSERDEGAVFVYYGSATGISNTPDIILQSDVKEQYMGWAVDGAGDLNGDGYSDIIVGSNVGSNGNNVNEGLVWIFRGNATGLTNIFAHRLEQNQNGAQFGSSVAGAGDINGDGLDDVVIGAHRFDLNCPSPCDDGAVFIYYGSNVNMNRPLFNGAGSLTNPTYSQRFNSTDTSFRTGWAVAGAGDVNGDGYSDVIVGDWRDNIGGQNNEGIALVFHGSAAGLITTPATVIQNNQSNSWLGRSVSSAGDVNGDGYADVLIGASQYSVGSVVLQGAVYLHLGGPTGISPNFFIRYTGGVGGALLGESVSVAGDVNGDGYSDFIAGAYRQGIGGAARIYLGGTYVMAPTAPAIGTISPINFAPGPANSLMGFSVANAGDVNGDGYSDVIVGAPEASNGQANEGLAFLYYGSATGLAATPDVTLEMNLANARFGYSVATAGDVDGDGYADVIIGAPQAGGTGRAYIFRGGPGGLSTTPALTLNGTVGSRFGHAVSTAGDVNSDGFADVVIGAPVAGTASIHLGSGAGTNAAAHLVITGPQAGSSFGFAVATAGDVNGSGFSDVIVGAPDFSNGEAGEGAAYAYYGSDSGLVETQSWMREGNLVGARFGASVAGVGDMNGDGYFDAVVGAPNWSGLQPNGGAAYFFRGTVSGLINNPGVRRDVNQANCQFGHSVAEGGDINGDGYADFVVGAPLWTNGQSEEGRLYIYSGAPVGVPANGNWEPNIISYRSGWSVAGGGDVDGDGFSDVVTGSPNANADQGAFTLLRGNWSSSVSRPTRLYRADLFSPLATNALDPADGLYFGIGHVARSHMQRKPGRLIWEVVHEGQPYSLNPISNVITNSQGFTDLSAGWTDLGLNGFEIREQVYKEPFYRRYKWRVRVEWPIHRSMDGQRFSRWYYGYASAHGDIGVLPLELLEFSGVTERTSNLLLWTSATETGTSHFLVERSLDNRNFAALGTVQAAGTSFSLIDYHYEDTEPPHGLAYYRLRMQDLDGSYEHSHVIALQRATTFNVHPNPVAELLTWEVQDEQVQRARIIDALGREVADVPAANGYIQGGPLLGLTRGYYVLVLLDASGNSVARSRFLKE